MEAPIAGRLTLPGEDLGWVLRPQRILLSVVAALLVVLVDGADVVIPGADFVTVTIVVAALNTLWNAAALIQRSFLVAFPGSGDVQIAFDLTLAFVAVIVVDSRSSPMVWLLLLVPVMDALGRYGNRGGLAAWLTVTIIYMLLVLRLSADDPDWRALLRAGVQQSAAILGVTMAVSGISARVVGHMESIEQARLTAEEKRRHLWIVSRAARRMSASEAVSEVLLHAAEGARSLGFDRVDVCEHDGRRWRVITSSGDGHTLDLFEDPVLRRALTKASEVSVGVDRAGPDDAALLAEAGYEEYESVVRKRGDGTSLAFRGFHRRRHDGLALTDDSVETLVSHTDVALANARSRSDLTAWADRLDHRANHDELTGLPNRAHLLDHLHHQGASVGAVLFLDLDGFKTINDTIGHAAGDVVLCAVARRLEAAVKPDELAVRLGGDEFVVVARGRDHASLRELADHIIQQIRQPIDVGEENVRVGTSIGIAWFRAEDRIDPAPALRRADEAMYEAKIAGRELGTAVYRFADQRSDSGERDQADIA